MARCGGRIIRARRDGTADAGSTLRLGRRLHFVGWSLGLLNLDVEEVADRFVVDARHHVFEENERFLLELDERIFLRVAAEADAFLQVIEREKVIFPLGVDDVENDAAFEPAHEVVTELLFFFLVAMGDGFGQWRRRAARD